MYLGLSTHHIVKQESDSVVTVMVAVELMLFWNHLETTLLRLSVGGMMLLTQHVCWLEGEQEHFSVMLRLVMRQVIHGDRLLVYCLKLLWALDESVKLFLFVTTFGR